MADITTIEHMTKAKEIFHNLRVGDHLIYSGGTTWGKKVESKAATVISKGNCITIELDKTNEEKSNDFKISTFNSEKATISLGDLVTGEKHITPLYF